MTVFFYLLLLLFVGVSSSEENLARILRGEEAEDGFAPYMVSLQTIKNPIHLCGGSIIGARYILTAAHCFYDGQNYEIEYNREDVAVVTGTINWRKPNATYYIDQVIMHCNYDKPSYQNDLAILRLNDSIVWNSKTQAIQLPQKSLKNGTPVVLTGWGVVKNGERIPDELKKITLFSLQNEKCLEKWNYDIRLNIGNICTGPKIGEGACEGDSGGPLVANEILVGMLVWIEPCAVGYPDVYVDIHYYSDWINTAMSENEDFIPCQLPYI